MSIYHDTVHHNDGTHLHGPISEEEDQLWQERYMRIIASRHKLYWLPNGRWARRFLTTFTALLLDVREGRCNSEKMLLYAPCILRKIKNARKAPEIKKLIESRLDAWDRGD